MGASKFFDKFELSKHKIVELFIALGVGFATGFFLKRYANYVCAFIIFIVLMVVLQKFEFIHVTVNDSKIEEFFGIQATHITGDAISMFWEWVKLNATLAVSFIVGLLVGLKRS